jgi:hypothetical protein
VEVDSINPEIDAILNIARDEGLDVLIQNMNLFDRPRFKIEIMRTSYRPFSNNIDPNEVYMKQAKFVSICTDIKSRIEQSYNIQIEFLSTKANNQVYHSTPVAPLDNTSFVISIYEENNKDSNLPFMKGTSLYSGRELFTKMNV